MNVLDLFSGIGGFSLGLERAGMRTVAFCEIDPFARGVLAKHWPSVPISNDVTKREFREGEADVICGGFPCQDISLAGGGAGLAGERSGLWRELLRAIRLVRPRYAIVENVAALLGRGMGTVLGDLAEIGNDAEWHCIPAAAVGAPHRRDRVWIVAHPDGSRRAEGQSATAPMGHGGATGAGRGDVANAISGGLEGRAPLSGYLADELAAIERNSSGPAVVDADSYKAWCSQRSNVAPARGRRKRPGERCSRGGHTWRFEPDVGRVAHGVSARVDRLKGLGNAVVPQIPEIIGRAIMNATQGE